MKAKGHKGGQIPQGDPRFWEARNQRSSWMPYAHDRRPLTNRERIARTRRDLEGREDS